ncbi:MAG: S-layer homology domain-containing protein [Monoglobaceae bacterium]
MKKLFKKVIDILLVFALMLSICPVLSAGVYAENTENAAEAMSVLSLFGIVPDYYDYNADFGGEVSRAEFVDAVYKLICTNEDTQVQNYYYDVPPTHWAAKGISYLTEKGILKGSGNAVFEPDAPIERAAAYKILISIMGYAEYAEGNGGYPTGYELTARRIGIASGASNSGNLIRSDMFIILYNAATASLFDPVSYGGNSVEYKVNDAETILSVYRGIYYNTGKVNGSNKTSFTEVTLDDNEVLIDNTIYETELSFKEFLGEKVKFFYTYDKSTDKKTIIWVNSEKTNDCLNIEVNSDASFNEKTFELMYYNGSDKASTVSISRGVNVIYNGEFVKSDIAELFSMDRYTLKLVKNNGVYDTAVIRSYYNIVADTISPATKMVYDKLNPNTSIDLTPEKYDYFSLKQISGSDMDFTDLQEKQILSVYMSRSKRYLEVSVSGKKAEGSLDKIDNEDGRVYYTVSGIRYEGDNMDFARNVKLGDSVILYLDAFDKIAYAESVTSGYFAAFLINGTLTDGLSPTVKIKYLKQDGTVETAECAEKTTVDGTSYKSGNDLYSALSTSKEFNPGLALITLSSDGLIKEIDTAKYAEDKEGPSSLQNTVEYSTYLIYKTSGLFGPKIIADGNTKIFSVPAKDNIISADDDEFNMLTRSDIPGDTTLNAVEAYQTSKQLGIADYIVLYDYNESGFREDTLPIVVETVAQGMNDEGDIVGALVGYQGSNTVTINAENNVSFEGITPGSVIRVALNRKGEIADYKVQYDPENPTANTGKYVCKSTVEWTDDINKDYRTIYGYVNSISEKVVVIGKNNGSEISYAVNSSSVPVLIYDKNERTKLKVGSVNDARTYLNSGNDCSNILLFTRRMTPALIVIYN